MGILRILYMAHSAYLALIFHIKLICVPVSMIIDTATRREWNVSNIIMIYCWNFEWGTVTIYEVTHQSLLYSLPSLVILEVYCMFRKAIAYIKQKIYQQGGARWATAWLEIVEKIKPIKTGVKFKEVWFLKGPYIYSTFHLHRHSNSERILRTGLSGVREGNRDNNLQRRETMRDVNVFMRT